MFQVLSKDICIAQQYVMVARNLEEWNCPASVKLFHYIDDVLLTSDPLMDLEQWAPELIKHLESCGWAVNVAKIPSLKEWA